MHNPNYSYNLDKQVREDSYAKVWVNFPLQACSVGHDDHIASTPTLNDYNYLNSSLCLDPPCVGKATARSDQYYSQVALLKL